MVERANAEVLRLLRCLKLDFGDRDRWSELLPLVQHIINTSVNSRIGKTPNEMLFADNLLPAKNLPKLLNPEVENTIRCLSVDIEGSDLSTKANQYIETFKEGFSAKRWRRSGGWPRTTGRPW